MGTDRSTSTARLVELTVADPPQAWTAAGFAVGGDDTIALGGTTVRLVGREDGTKGIVRWTLAGVDLDGGQLDGLPSTTVDPSVDEPAPAVHPNGVTGIDHVVVATPDLERTVAACEAVGLECRRIRDTSSYGEPMRQAFFKLGPVVLEVVSGDTGTGQSTAEAPARWFGLALDVGDLDVTRSALTEGALGTTKGAVQAGRRIATLRHKDLGLSVAVALMDDHAGR